MTEQYKRSIGQVWKQGMSPEQKKQFLEELLRDEAAWKAALKKEYQEELNTGIQYLAAERSAEILQSLHEQILQAYRSEIPGKKATIMSFPARAKWLTGVAAAVVLAFLLVYRSIDNREDELPSMVLRIPAGRDVQLHANNEQANQTIRLEDGSQVVLTPGSSISHHKGFSGSARDIRLTGQASFEVAKDSTRPFTVVAGGIATTALGTKFLVSTYSEQRVSIRLFEGKVVVQSTNAQWPMKKVYLRPGEECSINRQFHQCTVKPFAMGEPKPGTGTIKPGKEGKEREIPVAIEFVQAPLSEVLTKLSKRYHVIFKYEEAEISNDEVTGKFLRSDSLETALSILRTINNLSFIRHGDTITVSKIK